jgi:hypothetical protein
MGSKKEEVDKLVDVLHKTIAGDEKQATKPVQISNNRRT